MAASEIRIKIPHPSSMLMLNVVGVLGLAAVVVAVGGLAGWLWGLLAAGVVMVGLSVIGATYDPGSEAASAGAEPAGTVVAVARSA